MMKSKAVECLTMILISVPLILYLYVHAYYMSWHLSDPAWLMHAKNHLVRGMFGGTGLALVGLIVTFGPFRKGEYWAWWTLLVLGIFAFGGFWLSDLIANFALPAEQKYAFLVNTLSSAFYISGLALAWQQRTR